MIKYKVKDIANDLGVQNKKITEILEKYCGVSKKTMMALTESEIDVIIDVVTRENSVPNFDKYFEARNAKLDKPEPEKKAAKTEGKADAQDKKSDKPEEKTEEKPAQSKQRKRKVIDTRQTNVDVERYNSKYDDLASDTSKSRSTDRDHTTKKQKFSNRTQKQRGRRQGKRETEAERLKRIAMERKQKPITVEIPDEITVNELALRLKATVAEVVKKAFLMGTMVTATDTIDFDTASLIAMEFHAKAAGVSVIVAINKMDKDGANPEQVKQQLTEYELVPEEWGGDTPCIPVSAKTKMGLDDLLEMVALVAEMKELRANPDRAAKGTVIEARLDKGRGPVATVLVQNGTLHKGDIIIAGTSVGRVRVMMNDKGERVQEAGPSVPVEITGLDEVPLGGDTFDAVSDERLARTLVEQRKSEKKEEIFNAQTKVTLDNLFDQLKLGEVKELQIIVKADVQGSVEAVKQSLEKLSNEEVRVNVIHGAVGAINESDVMLADASGAIIVGFNVRPDAVASANAERSGVDMRLYSVIYDCINEIEAAMKGMLAPKTREVVLGMAECRNVIKIKSVGTIAGSYVKSGKIQRGAKVRVIRDGIVIADDAIGSLQRFKDAVKEVNEGYECGIGLEKFNDLKENDMFEVYTIEEYRD